jgi:hypothetical protein
MRHFPGLAVLSVLAISCASYPAPTERVNTAESAIGRAQGAGASNVPPAALSLKLAQEEVQKAKKLMQDGDNKRAETMLMRAQADADLAFAQARENQAKNDAQKALDQVKELRGK